MIYIGIDPGRNGGIAVLIPDTSTVHVIPMPLAGNDIDVPKLAGFIQQQTLQNDSVRMIIEKVSAMPGQGVTSMFHFGVNVGILYGIAGTLGISYSLVTPQRWKRVVLEGTDKSKEAAIDYCIRNYPHVNLYATKLSRRPHDGMAEALCIATYGRLTEK